MKTNEISRENLITKTDYAETKKMPVNKPEVKTENSSSLKKDTLHISESKREDNILDKKINLADIPVKIEKPIILSKEGMKEKELDNALKKVNLNTDIINKGILFEKDNYYDKMIVRVYNKETGEMLKQIPPQDFLEFSKKSEEIMGILFDKTI